LLNKISKFFKKTAVYLLFGVEEKVFNKHSMVNTGFMVFFKVVNACIFSQVCSEVVLKTLELMSHLKQQMPDMETSFYRILQVQDLCCTSSEFLITLY